MAKQGMKRPERTKSGEAHNKQKQHAASPSIPVPEIQGKAKSGKEKAGPAS